jgi:hypothetical protein
VLKKREREKDKQIYSQIDRKTEILMEQFELENMKNRRKIKKD